MTKYYDKPNERWEEIAPEASPVRVTGDDLLSVLGYEARCMEALAESIAFQISKDGGLPSPSAETYITARRIAAKHFYR